VSRIHEALKRAELERADSALAKLGEAPAEPVVANHSPAAVAEQPAIAEPLAPLTPAAPVELLSGAAAFEQAWTTTCRRRWNPDLHHLDFKLRNPLVPKTEQFRTLRSRLYRVRDSQPLQTLLVTSALPGEGKTFTAANLAHACARQKHCRVLLIDADLRAPRMQLLLGAPANPGLEDYLQGKSGELDVIQRGFDDELGLIPAGKQASNPAELISSSRMKELIKYAKAFFDWIIIDSPPVIPVSDASVLASSCDGVLFVVRAGSTPSEMAQKAVRDLKPAKIVGVILNNVLANARYQSYYGAYGPPKSQKTK